MEGMFIFVCDRGFVIVGEARVSDKMAMAFELKISATIRKFGTTEGLSELQDGPTKDTVLDGVCERTLPIRSILDIIHVTEKGAEKWKAKLSAK